MKKIFLILPLFLMPSFSYGGEVIDIATFSVRVRIINGVENIGKLDTSLLGDRISHKAPEIKKEYQYIEPSLNSKDPLDIFINLFK